MNACLHIAWIAVRELLYERVFYILLSFAGLSLGLSLLLGQLTYAEQAKLTLDFMLGGIQLSMILFSVFMGISLFHREMTQGSISMVLSKPISRTSFLVGKYLGQLVVQGAVTLAMILVTMLLCSRFDVPLSYRAISQTGVLIFFEVASLSAMTYFFAVNAGGITAAVATLCLFALGHLRAPIGRNLAGLSELSVWGFLKTLIPDLEMFNMKAFASYGIALPWDEIGWISLDALCCASFFLTMAALCFHRKDIPT